MSNHKSIESTIKNLEIQVGQLAKQITENSLGGFGANTKKNPKEECKIVITRSKRGVFVENESGSNEGELVEYDEPSRLMDINSSLSKLVAEYWSSCRKNSSSNITSSNIEE